MTNVNKDMKIKKMGYSKGGMTKKSGYAKGGMTSCGASNPAARPVKKAK